MLERDTTQSFGNAPSGMISIAESTLSLRTSNGLACLLPFSACSSLIRESQYVWLV